MTHGLAPPHTQPVDVYFIHYGDQFNARIMQARAPCCEAHADPNAACGTRRRCGWHCACGQPRHCALRRSWAPGA